MRTELARLGIDRLAIGGALAVVVGLAASGWMIADLSKRRAAVGTLQEQVRTLQIQAGGISGSEAPKESPEKVAERLSRYVSAGGRVPELLELIAQLAGENNLGDVTPIFEEKPLDPASPDGPVLQSLGVTRSIAITVTFKSEYADAARFMGAAALLPRPLSIKSAQLQREFPKVAGSVVFEGFLAN